MTATINILANTSLRGSLIHAKELTEFPSDPQRNEQVLINGVLWIYSMVSGVLTWFPLNNKKNTHTHQQGLPSTDWNVVHNLGSTDFIVSVYDSDNNLMFPSAITQVTENGFHITFGEAVVGRAVVFVETEAFLPAVNTASVNANEVNIAGGAVIADSDGLKVNGNTVMPLDSQGRANYGTL